MAEKLNSTRRAFLSGLAATPLLALPIMAAPAEPSLAELMAAIRDRLDADLAAGSGWTVSITRTADGFFYASALQLTEHGQRPLARQGDLS